MPSTIDAATRDFQVQEHHFTWLKAAAVRLLTQGPHIQISPIPASTAPEMKQAATKLSPAPTSRRAAAFGVHIFTALGAGVALLALLEAVRRQAARCEPRASIPECKRRAASDRRS